jgi:hypothetical protein
MFFPSEITNDTTESLFVKRNGRSYVVYVAVLIAITVIIIALPFIYVDISAQGKRLRDTV